MVQRKMTLMRKIVNLEDAPIDLLIKLYNENAIINQPSDEESIIIDRNFWKNPYCIAE